MSDQEKKKSVGKKEISEVSETSEITSTQETRRLKDVIADLKEGKRPVAAGAAVLSSGLSGLKEYAIPIIVGTTLVIIMLSFQTILLPFVLALALVYLMEPVVSFLKNRTKIPRFVAVLLVYFSFIGVIVATSIVVVPPFVKEIVNLAETFPGEAQKFRTEQLPSVNAKLQNFLRSYLPLQLSKSEKKFEEASGLVRNARLNATKRSIVFANATTLVRHAYNQNIKFELHEDEEGGIFRKHTIEPSGMSPPLFQLEQSQPNENWAFQGKKHEGPIILKPGKDGSLSFDLNNMSVIVEKVDENKWIISNEKSAKIESKSQLEDIFNLERTLDGLIEEVVSISNNRLAAVVEFVKKAVIGVVGAFVAFILTLMVAAFISIDLPRVLDFFRGLVPLKSRDGYDILLSQMNRGLAGVVRGQLVICLVNGLLTWVGLAFLDVKFSVLLAVVAGTLSLIPVFGTIISTVPIVLVGFMDGFMVGLLALLWILIVHAMEAYVLNPKIIGSSAHIHPVIVIFALLAGESTFGLTGAVLAIPTASIILTLFDFVRKRAWARKEKQETPVLEIEDVEMTT